MTFLHASAILGAVAAWVTLWTLVLVVIADRLTDGGRR